MLADGLAHPPPNTIAHHGRSQDAAYGKAHSRGALRTGGSPRAPQEKDRHVAGKMSLAGLVHFFKIGVLEEACRFGKTLGRRLLRAHLATRENRASL